MGNNSPLLISHKCTLFSDLYPIRMYQFGREYKTNAWHMLRWITFKRYSEKTLSLHITRNDLPTTVKQIKVCVIKFYVL